MNQTFDKTDNVKEITIGLELQSDKNKLTASMKESQEEISILTRSIEETNKKIADLQNKLDQINKTDFDISTMMVEEVWRAFSLELWRKTYAV